jgi:predicted DNA-binding helix-hairpin-helix protein
MATVRALGHLAEPRRLARAVVAAYRRGWCDGVFVTAGVPKQGAWATEKLLEVVEALRYTLGFRGYVHVKVPSGADPRQLARLMGLVDRVSFQLEPACARAEEVERPRRDAGEESFATETVSQRTAALAAPRRISAPTRRTDPLAKTRLLPRRTGGTSAWTRRLAARPEPQFALFEPAEPFRKEARNR